MRQAYLASLVLLARLVAPTAASAQPAVSLDPKLCAPPGSPAAGSDDKKAKRKAQKQLDAAREAYMKGDFATAIPALQAAYAIEPGAEILYNIAQACREGGLSPESLALFEMFLKQPNLSAEQKQAAEQKLAELRPKVAEVENSRAVRALDERRYDEAAAGFQRALTLHPQPAYLFRLGEAQRLAGRNAEAIAAYQRLLRESPDSLSSSDARRQLATLKAQRHDEEATAAYDKGAFVQAILAWDDAYREEPRAIFLFHKAEAMRRTGQRKEAADAYERFLKVESTQEPRTLRQQAETWVKKLRAPIRPGESLTEEAPKPLHKRWWFWTLIGGAVAVTAVGIGVGVALTPRTPSPPDGIMVFEKTF